MANREELAKVGMTVMCSFALLFVAYSLVESIRDNGFFLTSTKKKWVKKKEGGLLALLKEFDEDHTDKETILNLLSALLDYVAFTEAQICVGDMGYLPKICILLDYPDIDVQQKTALVLNNLVMNGSNQARIRDTCIPKLFDILGRSEAPEVGTVDLFVAVLSVLINFTSMDESHTYVLPRMRLLYELLQQSPIVQIKLHVLKILVNLSTNKKICENLLEFDAQLLRCMETYVGGEVNEAFVLRAVTCCANVLDSLQRRWRYGREPACATAPEFVSEKAQGEMMKLAMDENEDIRTQARRCVAALRTPPTPSQSATSMDSLDILDVLQL